MPNVVFVVGLGSGRLRFLTAQAQSALTQAEVLCGYTVYLDLVRPYFPEKLYYSTGMTREIERCRWALETARSGRAVALVCWGDAGVYGMASPLLELAQHFPDVTVEVVPGLTAALSGGAVLGAPLAHDFCVLSLSDRLTPWEVIERRLELAAMGDFCIALYNPSSKGRPDYLARAVDILLANGKAPERSAACAEHWPGRAGKQRSDAGRAGHPGGYVHHRVCRQRRPAAERADGHAPGVPRMRVVVFSGTTEGRVFSGRWPHWGPRYWSAWPPRWGPRNRAVRHHRPLRAADPGGDDRPAAGADLCVDATHPYAVEATRGHRGACAKSRDGVPPPAPARKRERVCVWRAQRRPSWLWRQGGERPAGHRGQGAFGLCRPGAGRLFPASCPRGEHCRLRGGGHPPRNIIAMQGPFTYAPESGADGAVHIRFLVTKDGGAAGGFEEAAAALRRGAAGGHPPPPEQGETAEEILKRCKEMIR